MDRETFILLKNSCNAEFIVNKNCKCKQLSDFSEWCVEPNAKACEYTFMDVEIINENSQGMLFVYKHKDLVEECRWSAILYKKDEAGRVVRAATVCEIHDIKTE